VRLCVADTRKAGTSLTINLQQSVPIDWISFAVGRDGFQAEIRDAPVGILEIKEHGLPSRVDTPVHCHAVHPNGTTICSPGKLTFLSGNFASYRRYVSDNHAPS
jgi:hypothetical protein